MPTPAPSPATTPTSGDAVVDGTGVRPGGTGSARPVALHLDPALHEPVRRWVEGVLGWQVVDRQTGGLVPPTVHLLGPDARPPGDGVPRVLLLPDAGAEAGVAPDPATAARAAVRMQVDAVVVWPAERDRLTAIVGDVAQAGRDRVQGPHLLRIGGAAGGVGTTTVVLAVAGLAAWRGARTLATIRGDAPVTDATVVPAAALGSGDLWDRLSDVPGVSRLRTVRLVDPPPVAPPRDPSIEVAVLDHGVDVDTEVLVCRPDAAAASALEITTAAVVVVVGHGPVTLRELRQVAGGRQVLPLACSSRVARAGLRRHVPAGLPGAWLRGLLPLLGPRQRRPGSGGGVGQAGGTRDAGAADDASGRVASRERQD